MNFLSTPDFKLQMRKVERYKAVLVVAVVVVVVVAETGLLIANLE